MYDNRIGIRYTEACFYNSRGHKHIDVPIDEIQHDSLQFMFVHLAVGKCDICLRYESRDMIRDLINVINPVIDIVHLSASGKFTVNGFPHHLVIILHYIGLDRKPVNRRLLQNTHVTYPDQTHMERPWDRRGRQCQNVHIFLELFDFFFMGNTKTLFLVYDEKAEILKHHVF